MDAATSDGTGDGEGSSGRLRALVGTLVGLEAVALAAGAVVLVVAAFRTSPGADGDSPAALVALAVIALLIGAGLAWCSIGVRRGAGWARGPVLTWQLLQAGVGMPVSASGAWWIGVPLLAVAVVVGILVAGRHVLVRA